MASINFNSNNFISICVDCRIYLLQLNVVNGCWNEFAKIDLNSFELSAAKKEKNNSKGKRPEENKKDIILSSAFSNNFKFLAVATSSKILALFNLNKILNGTNDGQSSASNLLPPSTQQLLKTPTEVSFSKNDDKIFLADRSGSVYEFKITESGGLSKGQELLGHLSMLLDFCFSPDGKFILTADRDEKIRISHYPQTFVIENFCLGSTSFVKSICCADDSLAVSAGGDSVLRLWDFKNGICLFTSAKICDAPIRKIRTIQIKNSTRIIVLPDGRNSISLFELNKEAKMFSQICSMDCRDIDEKITDFCLDSTKGIVYCVGKKGIYFGDCFEPKEEMELAPINLNGDQMLWTDLAENEDKYPLDELYKVVQFGNAEMAMMTQSFMALIASCAVIFSIGLCMAVFAIFYYVSIVRHGGMACWGTECRATEKSGGVYFVKEVSLEGTTILEELVGVP